MLSQRIQRAKLPSVIQRGSLGVGLLRHASFEFKGTACLERSYLAPNGLDDDRIHALKALHTPQVVECLGSRKNTEYLWGSSGLLAPIFIISCQ